MHAAMQQVFLSMKADSKSQFPGEAALQAFFEAEMERQRAHFGATAYEQRLRYGKEHLRRIYVEQAGNWRRRVALERRIDRVTLNGVPLSGVLDKIEWLENGALRIVDYKTGKFDAKKYAAPNAENPNGGEYWRQMAFYTLLLQNARIYGENVEKTAISWLEPDTKGTYRTIEISFDAAELELMRTLIKTVWDKIQSRQFTTGCGKPDCSWCRLHRERNPRFLNLEESPETELDDF
jgi:DNA helicase-2/ATP-dependent DNA helicase PcrA